MDADTPEGIEVAAGVFVRRHPVHGLVLASGEQEVPGVWPVRCFPLSDPGGAVSLCDPEGHEVAFVPRLDRLSGPARAFLETETRRREFVPVVRRILSTTPPAPPNTWEVETDRGRTTFSVQAEPDIRRLPPHGLLVVDARGVRFAIPDVRRLDRHSRRLLVPYR